MSILTRLLGADTTVVARTELDKLVLEVVERTLVKGMHSTAFTSAAWARHRDIAAAVLEDLYHDARKEEA